ncbi:MAG: transposase [Desulfurivibrionaceae bacterium]|jgi:hypothetical protein
MVSKRRRFTREFKIETVRLLTGSDQSVTGVADDLVELKGVRLDILTLKTQMSSLTHFSSPFPFSLHQNRRWQDHAATADGVARPLAEKTEGHKIVMTIGTHRGMIFP